MTFKWTPERDDELYALVASGKSAGQIAKIFGVSRNVIFGRKFRLGLCDPDKKGRPFTDHDTATLIALRERGLTAEEIAAQMQRSAESISMKARRLGICRPYRRSA